MALAGQEGVETGGQLPRK